MADGHDGMAEDRAGGGKARGFPDFFLCVRAVAVGPAVGAEGLGFHEGAAVAAALGVGVQGGAVRAEGLAAVVFPAIEGDHPGDGFLLPLALRFGGHQLILPWSTE